MNLFTARKTPFQLGQLLRSSRKILWVRDLSGSQTTVHSGPLGPGHRSPGRRSVIPTPSRRLLTGRGWDAGSETPSFTPWSRLDEVFKRRAWGGCEGARSPITLGRLCVVGIPSLEMLSSPTGLHLIICPRAKVSFHERHWKRKALIAKNIYSVKQLTHDASLRLSKQEESRRDKPWTPHRDLDKCQAFSCPETTMSGSSAASHGLSVSAGGRESAANRGFPECFHQFHNHWPVCL